MEKVKNTILIALATLGVLFIIIMIMPDDEEDSSEAVHTEQAQPTAEVADSDIDEDEVAAVAEPQGTEAQAQSVGESTDNQNQNSDGTTEAQAQNVGESTDNQPQGGNDTASANTAAVSIPQSELSPNTISFKTVSLDNKEYTEDIFSGYDLTIVHVWGTFCRPCIAEMGEYAKLYKDLPDNVNLIAIVSDVYDGIDSNVSDAKSILGDAGAEFLNLRTSDDIYGITAGLQFVPSSFFVDSQGHIIGSMLDGAGIDETKKRLDSYLQ